MSDECGVSFDYGDDWYSNELYVETWRKARKPHKCGECHMTIPPGTRYLRVVGKSSGSMWQAILCEPCNTILHEFNESSWEFGGKVWEEFQALWSQGEPLQPCLNRLTSLDAKVKLRDQWLRYKGIAG